MFKILHRKSVVLFVFFMLAVAGGALFFMHSTLQQGAGALEAHAANIFKKCSARTSSGERRICYEAEVPKLLDKISLKDAFRITELIQEQDSEYL